MSIWVMDGGGENLSIFLFLVQSSFQFILSLRIFMFSLKFIYVHKFLQMHFCMHEI